LPDSIRQGAGRGHIYFVRRPARFLQNKGSSSIGRVAVSKTVGWGFESLLACSEILMITKTKNFLGEVKVELQKASWPWEPKEKGIKRYKELTDSTLVVIIAMLLLGGYVSLFDFILVNVIHFFTGLH
jgi:preprotein translocase subunit SecE